jgi:hypothetical protein
MKNDICIWFEPEKEYPEMFQIGCAGYKIFCAPKFFKYCYECGGKVQIKIEQNSHE